MIFLPGELFYSPRLRLSVSDVGSELLIIPGEFDVTPTTNILTFEFPLNPDAAFPVVYQSAFPCG